MHDMYKTSVFPDNFQTERNYKRVERRISDMSFEAFENRTEIPSIEHLLKYHRYIYIFFWLHKVLKAKVSMTIRPAILKIIVTTLRKKKNFTVLFTTISLTKTDRKETRDTTPCLYRTSPGRSKRCRCWKSS